MTKEIWAAVIVAIAQIIVSILVAWKQISVAKALANPNQNQQKHKTNLLDKILRYFLKMPLHIIIPLVLFIAESSFLVVKHGFNIFIFIFIVGGTFLLIIQTVLWSMSKLIEVLFNIIRKHEKRLKCHESILFELTDKPCNEDDKCKFDV